MQGLEKKVTFGGVERGAALEGVENVLFGGAGAGSTFWSGLRRRSFLEGL